MTRDALSNLPLGGCQNPSLLLQHYAGRLFSGPGQRDAGKVTTLLKSVAGVAKDAGLTELYQAAFQAWNGNLSGETSLALELTTAGRLRIGAGNDNALEFSLRLHPLYGVPIIPGSAIKGLAAHYCHEVWGTVDLGFRRGGAFYGLLFGTTEEGGVIIFHDAWIMPDSLSSGAILRDVMTPHHQRWQEDKKAPTDFDSPIPVACLSVSGRFRLVFSWNRPAASVAESGDVGKWLRLAGDLVKEAVSNWGIGGKTSSGYGRMVERDARGAVGAVAATPWSGTPAVPPQGKRPAGTPVRLKFLGPREDGKKGFRAQEDGHQPGVLSLDDPPGALPEADGYFDGYIKDDAKAPQYLWNKPEQRKPSEKNNFRTNRRF